MIAENFKISKACEPCRRRKVRCDGAEPCSNCQSHPSACAYRLKARIRPCRQRPAPPQTAANSHSKVGQGSSSLDSSSANSQQESPTEVYDSIAAAHHAAQVTDSSQLFYGPSSTFAFIQQIHRQILPAQEIPDSHRCHGEQADGSGLDLFKQRAIFFGVPLRADFDLYTRVRTEFHISQVLSEELAVSFLDNFKAASLQLLPLFTEQGLDRLFHAAYTDSARQLLHPQEQALVLIILAIGALNTTGTELAETLFLQAKREAAAYEETVTLSMIQFSLLIADYQINMGRPNAAYLHVGAACRKALAWGLNIVIEDFGSIGLCERQTTLWCMYYMETWLSFTVGRRSMVQKKDIRFPCPENHKLLVGLSELAGLFEHVAESIYGRKEKSLWALYKTSETFHNQLQTFAARHGLGSFARDGQRSTAEALATMSLHNVYYHLIRTTFRPFLIAESVLKSKGKLHEVAGSWFQQACQVALDAAVDSIVFMDTIFRSIDPTKVRRENCFIIEASCALLLQNSLLHPEQHQDNLVYVHMALKCLRAMVHDEPVTNVISSIRHMSTAVQEAISSKSPVAPISVSPTDGSSLLQANSPHQQHDSTLMSAVDDFVLLRDGNLHVLHGQYTDPVQGLGGTWTQSFPTLDIDVLTADLSGFFPSNADVPPFP